MQSIIKNLVLLNLPIWLLLMSSGSAYSQGFPVSGHISTTNGVGINLTGGYLNGMRGLDQSKYVNINTKIPYENQKGMTSIYIDYYGYGQSWRMMVGWYVYQTSSGFINTSLSIVGDYVGGSAILSNNNGFVRISIPISVFSSYGNITVNSMTRFLSSGSTWANGWTLDKEGLPGTHQKTLQIQNKLSTDGAVGIGTTSPSGKLDVVNTGSTRVNIESKGSGVRYGELAFKDNGSILGYVWTVPESSIMAIGKGSHQHINMRLDNDFVGIGTTSPAAKLDVNGNTIIRGNIESQKVKVTQTPGNWPDYVFEPYYQLPSINELEGYIQRYKHLPGVPSAKEVTNEGIDLGHMDATLLKKIEELTLYTIDQEKRIAAQNKLIEQLIKRIEKLEK